MANQARLFEGSQIVANRCRRNQRLVFAGERLRPDRRGRRDVLLDDVLQDSFPARRKRIHTALRISTLTWRVLRPAIWLHISTPLRSRQGNSPSLPPDA